MTDVETEKAWIPLGDGTRLSARIWRPAGQSEPLPAVLEYLPYRKDDMSALWDIPMFGYFAGNGYVGVKVDIRGTGNSEGLHSDEYSAQETDDACEAIAWIAEQEWCSGAVGMFGISYGGFNSLQIAARRPPGLKAVVSAGSADDRFGQDVHRIGGCVHTSGLVWASYLFSFDGLPPHPAIYGPGWRDAWHARLEALEPAAHTWLAHQRRDDYWKHGSVCEDYDAIDCAVYMVGGWTDRYRDSVLTFLENRPEKAKGIIGPWEHAWPHRAGVGPAVNFLPEMLRWYDHWLKGVDNGVMDEPRLHAWITASHRPAASFGPRPGEWLALDGWTGPAGTQMLHPADDGTLGDAPPGSGSASASSYALTGLAAGESCAFRVPESDLAGDQRVDDALSLSFTTAPLTAPLRILGVPRLAVRLAADRPLALVAARLCDVAPDGASTLITPGLLNLTHRNGSEHPAPLEPGQPEDVTITFLSAGYEVAEGHRLRVALSPTYWPWAWPSPESVTLTCSLGPWTRLELPVPGTGLEPAAWLADEEIEIGPAPPVIDAAELTKRELVHDPATGAWELRTSSSRGRVELTDDRAVAYEFAFTDATRIREGDPLSARFATSGTHWIAQGELEARVETTTSISADRDRFLLTSRIEAFEDERSVFTRAWDHEIPRDLL